MIYKFIDIENYELISEKVYKFVVEKTPIMQENAVWNFLNKNEILQEVPDLLQVFKDLGELEAWGIFIVKCKPKIPINMHIDSDTHARLLWPIKNCEGSYNKFFEVESADIENRYGVKGDLYYHIKNTEKAKLLETVELTQPIVFKPWIPHGVWPNPNSNEPRITMTIKFSKSLEYMLHE